MIAIYTIILCCAMRNEQEKKRPHRPNHTKADGVKRKGREHYGSDMLILVLMQTKCQHNREIRIIFSVCSCISAEKIPFDPPQKKTNGPEGTARCFINPTRSLCRFSLNQGFKTMPQV
jgi:hypothetical protein